MSEGTDKVITASRRRNMVRYLPSLTVLTLVESLLGVGALFGFLMVEFSALKAIFLFLGVAITLLSVFRWVHLFLAHLPEGHLKRLASSSGIFSAGLYGVLGSQSVIWIGLAWIAVLFGLMAMLTALQRIMVEHALLRKLWQAYGKSRLPDLPVPFAYIHAEPGFGVYVAQRLVAKLVTSLWEHQYLSPKSGLSVYTRSPNNETWWRKYLYKRRQRAMMLFIVSDSVRRYPSDFRKWLASHAAAFILIRTPIGVDESGHKSFEHEASSGCDLCLGPTFAISVPPSTRDESSAPYEGDQTLQASWGLADSSLESVIAPISTRLASTALPMVASDGRLGLERRLIIPHLATNGLPPIANAYLRFRLAQSDVERFLAILDSIECLTRMSALVLLLDRWNDLGPDASDQQFLRERPTLGSWVRLLERLTTSTSPERDGVEGEIRHFWKGGMSQIQEKAVSKVKEGGLYSVHCKGIGQLDWLRWFTDVRNATRGHGVVEEASLAPFWHPLHECFLDMVAGLGGLVFSAHVVLTDPNGERICLQGWDRRQIVGKVRRECAQDETFAFLECPGGQLLLLYPLFVVRGDKVLVFDHLQRRERTMVYLDFRSGDREQVLFSGFPDIDAYKIWISKRHTLTRSLAKFRI